VEAVSTMQNNGPVTIAIDGSPHSQETIDWGVEEAERRGAPVVLVQTYEDPGTYAWGWIPVAGDPGLLEAAKDYLDTTEEFMRQRHPGVPITALLVHGATVPALRDESDRAQLLVVGAGDDGDSHRVGSVAAHLAAHGRCPVAVVRSEPHLPPWDDDDFTPPRARPVVVGVDGSRASIQAAYMAAEEAATRGVPLELVHARPTVAAPFGGSGPQWGPEDADPSHHAALRVADALRDTYPRLTVQTVLVDDEPAHALIDASVHAQLLVVGSRGLGAFRGMLLGAVSGHAVRGAACTVLVLHGDQDD
jgi:nucleotide-binding universal stress UspA family protein